MGYMFFNKISKVAIGRSPMESEQSPREPENFCAGKNISFVQKILDHKNLQFFSK